jgi:hypothetical protein
MCLLATSVTTSKFGTHWASRQYEGVDYAHLDAFVRPFARSCNRWEGFPTQRRSRPRPPWVQEAPGAGGAGMRINHRLRRRGRASPCPPRAHLHGLQCPGPLCKPRCTWRAPSTACRAATHGCASFINMQRPHWSGSTSDMFGTACNACSKRLSKPKERPPQPCPHQITT